MSDGPERLRLFLAVSVPLDVLSALNGAIEPQRASIAGARWGPLENQHITLKFLGSVTSELLPAIATECRALAGGLTPGAIAVAGLGAFPTQKRARVVWAGIEDEDELLSSLAHGIDERLAPLGFAPEKRSFTPHLTVARLKTPASARAVVEAVSFRSDPFEAGSFHLFRSRLSPKGARYEVLDTYVLGSVGA